jgi:hypothetical protein
MKEPPWGYRLPEDEHLFARPTKDPSIEPDRVSPAVEGYFRLPAVWVGDEPEPETVLVLNPNIHHALVFKQKLRCGIEVRVQRDGAFLFDFSSWPLAPTIVIHGYKKPDPEKSYRVPREHTREEEKAEAYAILRAQVMNVHQACLTTSESVVKKRGATMGNPVTAWNTLKAISFEYINYYNDDTENIHSLGQNILNNKDRIPRQRPLPRRVLELEVVAHSIDLLDSILSQGDIILIQMVEAAYVAASRRVEKRFGESVTLAWGVCEQLISQVWGDFLKEIKLTGIIDGRMPKDRFKKLIGRDYTASVMVEILELNGKIDHQLYRLLEVARKARNNWVHQMRVPKESESNICIQAVQRLFNHVKGFQLSFQSGSRGGVPQWPVWMWEEIKARGNTKKNT